MADGLGCGVNSVVGAQHNLRALRVSFDRTKREAQLPQNRELADRKMCVMAGAGAGVGDDGGAAALFPPR